MKCPKCGSTDIQFEYVDKETKYHGEGCGCGVLWETLVGGGILSLIVGAFSAALGGIAFLFFLVVGIWRAIAGEGRTETAIKHYRCKSCGETWKETESEIKAG